MPSSGFRRIIKIRNITWSEARELIEKRLKEGMTTIHHDRVYQYLDMFSILPADVARSMVEELVNEAGISEGAAVTAANICPRSRGEVRSILEMDREAKYSEEVVRKVYEIAEKYCSEHTS